MSVALPLCALSHLYPHEPQRASPISPRTAYPFSAGNAVICS
jgi:hypothetical protein